MWEVNEGRRQSYMGANEGTRQNYMGSKLGDKAELRGDQVRVEGRVTCGANEGRRQSYMGSKLGDKTELYGEQVRGGGRAVWGSLQGGGCGGRHLWTIHRARCPLVGSPACGLQTASLHRLQPPPVQGGSKGISLNTSYYVRTLVR